ncbi:MAG: urea ABC transporter permease subunit UrtB, partial [Rhodospirillales bacterium]|nr:urea ABC transporter permease subunit UrtB [Rhodospirillales bacterium]
MLRLPAWLMLVLLVLAPLSARAQETDDAYAALAGSAGIPSAAGFDSVRRGVEQLATSGDPRAAVVIGALQAGQLYARADRALFIKQPDGSFVDARSGAPAPDAAGLRPVRLNNAVRSAIDAALGSLRLFAPDAATRLAAAEAVFKSHDPAALPALTRALAKESDAAVKTRMQQARAAALLSSGDASEADRLAAVAMLRARGDIDARGFLASLS